MIKYEEIWIEEISDNKLHGNEYVVYLKWIGINKLKCLDILIDAESTELIMMKHVSTKDMFTYTYTKFAEF